MKSRVETVGRVTSSRPTTPSARKTQAKKLKIYIDYMCVFIALLLPSFFIYSNPNFSWLLVGVFGFTYNYILSIYVR